MEAEKVTVNTTDIADDLKESCGNSVVSEEVEMVVESDVCTIQKSPLHEESEEKETSKDIAETNTCVEVIQPPNNDVKVEETVKMVFEPVVCTIHESPVNEKSKETETSETSAETNTCIEVTQPLNNGVEQQEKSIVLPLCDTNKEEKSVSSLGIIALEYDDVNSDSGESSNESHVGPHQDDTKGIEVEMHSYRVKKECSSSDSEDDSSSSSDCSVASLSDDDSDGSINKKERVQTKGKNVKEMKNEWDDLPPIEDLKISVPEVLCEPLGQVAWMVEQIVVVEPKPGKPTLNLDTVLFVERGKRALGKIFDVFGQVNEPHYCVRFNTTEHIKESDIKVGMTVYFCPSSEYTSLVFLHELMKLKGIDALGDDEPPQFSDDEEERLYYEQQRKQQQNKTNEADVPSKRKRVSNNSASSMGWQTNNPWNRNPQRPQHSNRPNRGRGRQASNRQWVAGQNQWPTNNYVFGAYTSGNYGMQYPNYGTGHTDPSFAGQQHGYQGPAPMFPGPRSSYNFGPRYPTSFPQIGTPNLPYQNLRFRPPSADWPTSSQFDPANPTWASLPPPPPPPPSKEGS